MVYTLGEAAKATGRSKATISKAIKTGRISATKNEMGTFEIDPSELHRVYAVSTQGERQETAVNPPDQVENISKIRELQARLDAAGERLADKDAVIADLREDRDKWRQQASALLTDKRESTTPPNDSSGFWSTFFRRKPR